MTLPAANSQRSARRTSRSTDTTMWSPLVAVIGLYLFASAFFLAKKSLLHVSTCDEARELLHAQLEIDYELLDHIHLSSSKSSHGKGNCWMDQGGVDSMVILVVDALRFDFALHNLPLSVGSRLSADSKRSQLLQFVADPPTVTMQRLKGLTTGSLPTFADISNNFGGAEMEEDSWIDQMVRRQGRRMAFVGDDTWIDLFPTQFDEAHPFPSFNTRDLNTVDDGCLKHLPHLMEHFGRKQSSNNVTAATSNNFDVVVAHFLGVDHVGHTYGPHTKQMAKKLHQMDVALEHLLTQIDYQKEECQVALIFGDHGMTEEGNHGGGTPEEINAALFVHASPKCGSFVASRITGSEIGRAGETAFESIHQIDLVPTISIWLGLPIPYASLGGLVPSLMMTKTTAKNEKEAEPVAPVVATSLALNAAQVWRYLTTYSSTANRLPQLDDLKFLLNDATKAWKEAVAQTKSNPGNEDSIAYREACAQFKRFLSEATYLGKRVWTRFDTRGMAIGAIILFAGVLGSVPLIELKRLSSPSLLKKAEIVMTAVLILFQCVLLTFSNSYIDAEQRIVMFALANLCLLLACRLWVDAPQKKTKIEDDCVSNNRNNTGPSWFLPLAIAVSSRANELLISGHGLDPSLRQHVAHNPAMFLGSLIVVGYARIREARRLSYGRDFFSLVARTYLPLDIFSLFCLAISWWEKWTIDASRNGYLACRTIFVLTGVGLLLAILNTFHYRSQHRGKTFHLLRYHVNATLFKLIIFIMCVTGPSSSSSLVLFLIQVWALEKLMNVSNHEVGAPVMAALWRLCIRHAFFATSHACAFNRLQYSAAFVASEEFEYYSGGISLFLNTFGLEICGLCLVAKHPPVFKWLYFYQLLEAMGSCVSVSLMRRHLMVWAIFAPRFIFASIFMVLSSGCRVGDYLLRL